MELVRARLAQCVSQFDIFRFLREITGLFGFRYFLVANRPGSAGGPFSESVVITSVPSEFTQKCEDVATTAVNPLAAVIRETSVPSEYRFQDGGSLPPGVKALADAARIDADVSCWFVVPLYDPEHGPAAVSFMGQRPAMGFTESAELTLYAHLIHEKLREVSAKPVKTASPLSDRERECLLWTAAGKTSVEIGQILDLSEHTVNHYLNNVARKVGAVNRTQAVAYAMRNGYID
ncbi:LuxR C-terminal-related transcriptional regulator [Hoeflea olei]|uniref:HTH luxR-type domain-containing protein n=1 Tax=Hoeflea olei TaxID=1480615 RepID=A0A1C1YUA0_9HYPH|nr:LuxR C-terminal-related transcriptional regulator [Hoeflea olei]OCW57133.1 hypothetical protein AWJ14_08320 [Hoeflea olei]